MLDFKETPPSENVKVKSVLGKNLNSWRHDPIFQSTWSERFLISRKYIPRYLWGFVGVTVAYSYFMANGWGHGKNFSGGHGGGHDEHH